MIDKELRIYVYNHLFENSNDKNKEIKKNFKELYNKKYKNFITKSSGVIGGKPRVIDTRLSTNIIFEYFKYLYEYKIDKYNDFNSLLKEIISQFPSIYNEDRVIACLVYELSK